MIEVAAAQDRAAIENLLDICFGPARRARTAYRLREGVDASLELVVRDGGAATASLQLWPVMLRELGGRRHALTLLGPLAVAPARRCEGLGSALIEAALARVEGPVVLIGDAPYYARFGFDAAATQGWAVPGSVDRARLLVRGGAGLPVVGRLGSVVEMRRAA